MNIIVEILEVRQMADSDTVIIEARVGDNGYIRKLSKEMFLGDDQKFAEWIITQKPDYVILPEWSGKKLKIKYHKEIIKSDIAGDVEQIVLDEYQVV